MRRSSLGLGIVASSVLALPVDAGELPALESLQTLQFDLVHPGARSLGMAGAFIGRADDATTAYANAAGLTRLEGREILLEGRRNEYSLPYTAGGSWPDELDRRRAEKTVSNVSFAAFVWPLSERLVTAAYFHRYVDFESTFVADVVDLPFGFSALPSSNFTELLQVDNYGLSAGWRLSEHISVGLGIDYFVMNSLISQTDSYQIGTGQLLGRQATEIDDSDMGFNLGVLWRISDDWTLGLVYRSAPEFDGTLDTLVDDSFPVPPPSRDYVFEAPAFYGVGLSWRVSAELTLGLDINRVEHATVAENVFSTTVDSAEVSELTRRIGIDDGTEFRLGAEYLFNNPGKPLALRAGVWLDPDHFLDYADNVATEPPPSDFDEVYLRRALYDARYRGGTEEWHYALGVGMTLLDRFQFSAGADLSRYHDIYSLSGTLRF